MSKLFACFVFAIAVVAGVIAPLPAATLPGFYCEGCEFGMVSQSSNCGDGDFTLVMEPVDGSGYDDGSCTYIGGGIHACAEDACLLNCKLTLINNSSIFGFKLRVEHLTGTPVYHSGDWLGQDQTDTFVFDQDVQGGCDGISWAQVKIDRTNWPGVTYCTIGLGCNDCIIEWQ